MQILAKFPGRIFSSRQSVNLEDIPKQNNFPSITKEDTDDIKSYEKLQKKEMIFLLENSDLHIKDEPWNIFQRYIINGLYYPGESYKTRSYYEEILISSGSAELQHFSGIGYSPHEKVYNFSKIIIIQVISVEDWAFDKVLYYNNDRHKHTWFIKVCAKIFAEPIPNWFINWWSYHGPMDQILPEQFLKLYKEWTKVSPDLNKLYLADHICWLEKIYQIYFFIEFSIPWIHKWTLEVGFTEENSPCLYRTYYNNFWNKLMKQDPKTKQHIAKRISFQDGDKESMINDYLEEVIFFLLQTITQIDKLDTSMQSETSNDDIVKELH
ncbi:hypothetical protein H5410_060513 [Solanum commersonii]|uniref:Uncharacterized protein n=1 Tax=Solanum commersonii TaxID=4109 RepID=A0A9J5W594_SOLCO|nr:hypothetical protein H5410_060513 [Solanum commersonii]